MNAQLNMMWENVFGSRQENSCRQQEALRRTGDIIGQTWEEMQAGLAFGERRW